MADPDLKDLAALEPAGTGLNAVLMTPAGATLATLSDGIREILGRAAAAERANATARTRVEAAELRARRYEERLRLVTQMHVERMDEGTAGEYGEYYSVPTGRCAACKRKWPCATRKVLTRTADEETT